MQEPAYSMASVEPAVRDLSGTVVTRLEGRTAWIPQLAEMLLLCNEAARSCVFEYREINFRART